MSWNIKTPGDYINGPLTVAGDVTVRTNKLVVTSTGVGAGTANPQAPFEIAAAASAKAKALQFSTVGSPSYGWIIAVDGAVNGNMILQSNNNNTIADVIEVSRANGNVGFGLAPLYKLHTGSATYASIGLDISSITNTACVFKGTPDGVGYEHAKVFSGRDATAFSYGSYLAFYTEGKSSGTTDISVERARFNSTGALVFAGGSAGANGVGIAFPSAQSASTDANTLDDYEEGTFTASITGGTTNPTSAVNATGRYTKIGRVVTIHVAFTNVDTTGASGTFLITGLPFACAAGFSSVGSAASYAAITFTGSIATSIGSSETFLTLLASQSGAVWNAAQHNAGGSRYFVASITYTV